MIFPVGSTAVRATAAAATATRAAPIMQHRSDCIYLFAQARQLARAPKEQHRRAAAIGGAAALEAFFIGPAHVYVDRIHIARSGASGLGAMTPSSSSTRAPTTLK